MLCSCIKSLSLSLSLSLSSFSTFPQHPKWEYRYSVHTIIHNDGRFGSGIETDSDIYFIGGWRKEETRWDATTRTWSLKVVGKALVHMRLGHWRHRQPSTINRHRRSCFVINGDWYVVSSWTIRSADSDDIEHDHEQDVSWIISCWESFTVIHWSRAHAFSSRVENALSRSRRRALNWMQDNY